MRKITGRERKIRQLYIRKGWTHLALNSKLGAIKLASPTLRGVNIDRAHQGRILILDICSGEKRRLMSETNKDHGKEDNDDLLPKSDNKKPMARGKNKKKG